MPAQPPSEEALVACLAREYGVAAARVALLPLGADKHAWVYRVDVDAAAGAAYFLKVRRAPPDELRLAVPRALRDAGVACVAPLPAANGRLWSAANAATLVLYPFIAGRAGMDGGLTPPRWEALGAALRQLHAAALPPALARALPRERFVPSRRLSGVVRALLAGRHEQLGDDEPRRAVAALLRAKRADVRRMLDRLDALGRYLRAREHAAVICHADIHINNVMLDAQGRLWIVDWDQPLIAPPERDLMCLLGPAMRGVSPGSPEEAAFWRGYGPYRVDPALLTYYRYERAMEDLGENAELVYWMPDRGPAARRAAARRLTLGFEPDRQLAEALRADDQLPGRP